MLKILSLSILQALFLCGGQVFLKIAMNKIDHFHLSWKFIIEQAGNWAFLATGICMSAATILWLYILKHFEFSIAYSLTSISYLFGMLAAIYIFHETVTLTRWAGLALIIAGILLITKQA
jgi:undecaprenyl phosphate-alpha-L-ara4N flippase subunit ArnE